MSSDGGIMSKKLGLGSIIFGVGCLFFALFGNEFFRFDSDLNRPLLYIGAAFGITGIFILNKFYNKEI
jgi:hypothetical protein